ncbi:hypothetical protein C1645_829604 [Glomus cerebriforme]|uniref:MACPF domain-containing protein n=1 Tax=Glomus cerebriforme TaxID=658196 RepID=A0A397SU42_9GLOM|nr:hypothetical protein C1645_829604 [Glomus cerebriforme]
MFNPNFTGVVVETNFNDTPKLVPLVLTNKLPKVRTILKEYFSFEDFFLFTKEIKDGFAEIAVEDENKFNLYRIVNNEKRLRLNFKPSWNYFNNRSKIDYGYIMSQEKMIKAEKRAYIMNNCNFDLISKRNEFEMGDDAFNSKEDRLMKKNLFFNVNNINVYNLLQLGMSFGKSNNETFNIETDESYEYMKYTKATLDFENWLSPTDEFKDAIEEAIKTEDVQKLKKVFKQFGEFIPTQVILGGRVHFNKLKVKTEHATDEAIKGSLNINQIAEVAYDSKHSQDKTSSFMKRFNKIIGGELHNDKEFDKSVWSKSLEKYRTWEIIEFGNPKTIFYFLSDKLREKIYQLIGKKIIYNSFKSIEYKVKEDQIPTVFKISNMLPTNISDLLGNKDIDIFATVVDNEINNDLFTCQILYRNSKLPELIIQCLQRHIKVETIYHIKVGLLIIGNCPNFSNILTYDKFRFYSQKNQYNEFENLNNTHVKTSSLKFKRDIYSSNEYYLLGISLIKEINESNKHLFIGHHFVNDDVDDKLKTSTFCLNLKDNNYAELSADFTFSTLIAIVPNNACKIIDLSKLPFYIDIHSPVNILSFKSLIDRTCAICKRPQNKDRIKCILFDPSRL